ncbi:MAG: hypothetical protein N2662_09950 [Bacteroidales bacterium]|nr:hypothetical protein [Bacteroidales bacterium]
MLARFFALFTFLFITVELYTQSAPAEDENIPYLVTFSKQAETSWGDDDFVQIFFFLVPEKFKQPIYIRVYDPDCGGDIDELNGVFDSQTRFSVYGGRRCWSDDAAQSPDPVGNYKSGNLLDSKTFGEDPKWDKKWYTFGPYNPNEGELVQKFGGYVFKIVAEGISGDDGNLYKFFLSTSADENKPIEGGNAFAYEYTFRMWDDPKQVSHIYPYVDDRTISVKVSNFDWDDDGFIRIVSVARKGQILNASGDDNWVSSEFKILAEEKNTSLDIQMIKNKTKPVKNNNVVVNVRNQYGELLPFYTVPIGGVPKYKYSIGVKQKE